MLCGIKMVMKSWSGGVSIFMAVWMGILDCSYIWFAVATSNHQLSRAYFFGQYRYMVGQVVLEATLAKRTMGLNEG